VILTDCVPDAVPAVVAMSYSLPSVAVHPPSFVAALPVIAGALTSQ
jgi:hypothetical protein